MEVKRFLGFTMGMVSVSIEGFWIEKVINTCKKERIVLIGLRRERSTIAKATVCISDYKALAKIAKLNKCRIKIKKKSGLPFIARKYKKRKIFVLSLISVSAFIIVISNFVWNIEIVGLKNIDEGEIVQLVKNEGIDIGRYKGGINPIDVVEKIRMARADISWVGIKVSGTNVRIEIVEADMAPKIIDEKDFCDIVATKDAVIEKINAQNGTLQVKSGDEVKKRRSSYCRVARRKVYRYKIRTFDR